MDNNPYSTATMTKTVSGTKLAVATLAMFVAGGAAFAAVPVSKEQKRSSTSVYTVVSSSCSDIAATGTVRLSQECVATYSSGKVVCHDGAVFNQTFDACKTSTEMSNALRPLCNGRMNPRTRKVGMNSFNVGTKCEPTFKRAEARCAGSDTDVVATSSCAVADSLVDLIESQCSCSAPNPILRVTTYGSDNPDHTPTDTFLFPSSTVELATFWLTAENGPVVVDKFSVSLRNGENNGPSATNIRLGALELWHIEERVEVPVNDLLARATSRIVDGHIVYTFDLDTPITVYPDIVLPVSIYEEDLEGPLSPDHSPATVFTVVVSGDTPDFIHAESLSSGDTLSPDYIGGSFSVVGTQQNFSPYHNRYLATSGIVDMRNEMPFGRTNMELSSVDFASSDFSTSSPTLVYTFSIGSNDSLLNPESRSNYSSRLENLAIFMKTSASGMSDRGSLGIAYIQEVGSTVRIYPRSTPTSTFSGIDARLSSATTTNNFWFSLPSLQGKKIYEVYAYLDHARLGLSSPFDTVRLTILFDGNFGYQFGNRYAESDWSDGPVYYQTSVDGSRILSPIQSAWRSPQDLVMDISLNGLE